MCYFSAIKLYSTLLRVQKTTEESPTTRHHVTNNAVLLGKGCCPKVEALNQIKLPRKGYLCESSHSKGVQLEVNVYRTTVQVVWSSVLH